MGLLSIIRKQKLREKEVRVLMLGLDNSGKTTIVRSLLHKDIQEISPTMGFNIDTISYKGFNINVWDIGGQSSLRTFWFNYFERTDFLVWVLDASSLQRLVENFKEFDKVLREDRLAGCGLLILINKIDIYDGDRQKLKEAITDTLRLKELQNHSWNLLCCSAYTGENLQDGLDWLVSEYEKKYYIL
ncbi:DEKNAAC102671 [Brettanomyces naardenensis]|uniref:DEKNAAC102671 n=1 Tax=Brettanomyces naardenensis TaxID=13370 RepID=A0A448YK27_BRENA|nr:DEKNAAC102671 [Brettanomyces naardenensis]